jgi:hypothetical protein
MKNFSLFYIFPFLIIWLTPEPYLLDKLQTPSLTEIEGTWKVDKTFNETAWHECMQKGISHEWIESLIIRNDSFFMENHKWWPPHTVSSGKEYFAADFTSYIIGTFTVNKDTLKLNGYSTDYLYSTKVDSSYKYHPSFVFKQSTDTLELTENSYLKYRMIRKK